MELVHSSVVTVKLSQFNILCKNGIGESNIISDDINNIMNYLFFISSSYFSLASLASSAVAALTMLFWRILTGTSGPGTASAPHENQEGG